VTAGGCLGTSISEVEGIVTELPATVQPIVEGELTGLLEALGGVNGSLQTTASTSGGLSGGLITSEVGQVTSILDGILGDLPGLGGTATTGTGGTTTTGTGVTATTGTGVTPTTGTGVDAGIPPFLAKLFLNLGISAPTI